MPRAQELNHQDEEATHKLRPFFSFFCKLTTQNQQNRDMSRGRVCPSSLCSNSETAIPSFIVNSIVPHCLCQTHVNAHDGNRCHVDATSAEPIKATSTSLSTISSINCHIVEHWGACSAPRLPFPRLSDPRKAAWQCRLTLALLLRGSLVISGGVPRAGWGTPGFL